MPADPLLPPEAVAALVNHLRAAGREVALGLESAVKVLRGTLAARDAAPDPASLALDQTLARVEQGLALLALLAPAASPAAATGAAAARREAFEAVLRLVEGARLREDPQDPEARATREAILDELAEALTRELEDGGDPPTG